MATDLDDEWMMHLRGDFENSDDLCNIDENKFSDPVDMPIFQDLYISTKTIVLFLNSPIDIYNIFWKIPISEYNTREDCVIKKQMKIVSKTREEYEDYRRRLSGEKYYIENVIKQIDNPDARRIKFKDERKLTVGLSKKDIMVCRGKKKNAFYNCFAMILRFYQEGEFKEIHVKVFNTGKLEIPGLLNNELLESVKNMMYNYLQPHIDKALEFGNPEVVLINSNFNCGFYINRDKLHKILNSDKYKIESAYDPCSYPGVKCKFYYKNDINMDNEESKSIQNGLIREEDRSMKMSELFNSKRYREISFMIFRTGSCLVVGNCDEEPLHYVYEFIKQILRDEYSSIVVKGVEEFSKNKKAKIRKKRITLSKTYYDEMN